MINLETIEGRCKVIELLMDGNDIALLCSGYDEALNIMAGFHGMIEASMTFGQPLSPNDGTLFARHHADGPKLHRIIEGVRDPQIETVVMRDRMKMVTTIGSGIGATLMAGTEFRGMMLGYVFLSQSMARYRQAIEMARCSLPKGRVVDSEEDHHEQ